MKNKVTKINKTKLTRVLKISRINHISMGLALSLRRSVIKGKQTNRWKKKGTEVLGKEEDFLRGRRKKQRIYIKVRGKLKDTGVSRLVPKGEQE